MQPEARQGLLFQHSKVNIFGHCTVPHLPPFSPRTWLTWGEDLSFNEISHFNEKNRTMADATHSN